jgi:hypothetical protein
MLLPFPSPFMRADGAPELPVLGKLVADGTQCLAPTDSRPPCHYIIWQILNFGLVQRTFKSMLIFLLEGR